MLKDPTYTVQTTEKIKEVKDGCYKSNSWLLGIGFPCRDGYNEYRIR